MKSALFTIILSLFIVSAVKSKTHNPDYLLGCWEKQVKPIKHQYLKINYKETEHQLYHSFEPWQQVRYGTAGMVVMNRNFFYQKDSMKTPKHVYTSQTQYDYKTLLTMGLGDTALSEVTREMFLQQPFEIARYSPLSLIDYAKNKRLKADAIKDDSFAVYTTIIDKVILKIFIRKSDSLLVKITKLQDDDLYGDELSTYTYSSFSIMNGLNFSSLTVIKKFSGKVNDTVRINSVSMVEGYGSGLVKPRGYQMKYETSAKPEMTPEPYSQNIHFLDLKHTNDRVMIVEFKDFLLVAEAPQNSRNGELIMQEAKKIAPSKPVRYFVFCHFHPDYIGGVRAFVHKGATIISATSDIPYVQHLVTNPHTLNPDSLQLQPKPLKLEEIRDSLTFTDNNYTMKIYFIGKKSAHTNDYLIYYFPSEKMVFEGDLVWMKKNAPIAKAGKRDAALYHAIKDLKLDVKTIVQSWPLDGYGLKTIIPFEELEKSVEK